MTRVSARFHRNLLLLGVGLAIGFLRGATALARDPVVAATIASRKAWAVSASAEALSNLYGWNTSDHTADLIYLLNPEYRISKRWTASLLVQLDQQLTQNRLTRLGDTQATLMARGFRLSNAFDYEPSVSLTLPTSRQSWHDDSLIAAGTLEQRIELATDRLGIGRLSAYSGLSATYMDYKYLTSTSGESNPRFQLAGSAFVGYRLLPEFTLSALFARTEYWTYAGTPRGSFLITEDLTYELSEKWSASIGHANSGDAYKDNWRDSNIALFNGNTSTVYAKLTVTL